MPNTTNIRDENEMNRLFKGDTIGIQLTDRSLESVRAGQCEIEEVASVLPKNRVALSRRSKKSKELLYDMNDQDELANYQAFLQKCYADGGPGSEELAAYRRFQFAQDIHVTPFALASFQDVTLADDEIVVFDHPQSAFLNEYTVRSTTIGGDQEMNQWSATMSMDTIPMEMITTEKVEWRWMDLQTGNISAEAAIKAAVDQSVDNHMEDTALANIDAAQVNTGLRSRLRLSSRLIPANFPDTNYLDLTGSDAGIFTISKLKAILLHSVRFGGAGGPDEPFKIAAIHFSPQNAADPWDWVDLVSGWNNAGKVNSPDQTVTSAAREAIFSSGGITQAWGQSFSWLPNHRIAKGRMYVTMSQPLGWVISKPGLDQVIQMDPTNWLPYKLANKADIVMKKAVRFYRPDAWANRIIIVDF